VGELQTLVSWPAGQEVIMRFWLDFSIGASGIAGAVSCAFVAIMRFNSGSVDGGAAWLALAGVVMQSTLAYLDGRK